MWEYMPSRDALWAFIWYTYPFFLVATLIVLGMLGCVARAIERDGLVGLLPCGLRAQMHRPIYELIRAAANRMLLIACDIMRVSMLCFVELNEEQSREILEGLNPSIRRAVFQRTFVQNFPYWVQRIILGRHLEVTEDSKRSAKTTEAATEVATTAAATSGTEVATITAASSGTEVATTEVAAEGCGHSEDCGAEAADQPGAGGGGLRRRGSSEGSLRRLGSAEGLMEVVRGMEDLTHLAEAKATVLAMERVLIKKMAGSTVNAAQSLAKGSIDYTKAKASQFGEGVRDVVTDPRNRAAAATSVGCGVALGAGGGATGLVSGGLIGAAAGIIPAVFTFGLSIPVFAAIGGGAGMFIGGATAGSVGLVGGGVAGYRMSGSAPEAPKKRPAGMDSGAKSAAAATGAASAAAHAQMLADLNAASAAASAADAPDALALQS
eukprot:TRINITY_DN19275_c2_g1_i1.p1 TRINITY_DN19275_c2_g1~~TRINITY_DN19275_c2_g1_i1.p1  ORF type:complete len:437 (-),score=89.72 TRINITY_DN19275_c2_g1_i1:25-1335(-)